MSEGQDAFWGFPLGRWAKRFRHGQAVVHAALGEPLSLDAYGVPVQLAAGPVVLHVWFSGGESAHVTRAVLRAQHADGRTHVLALAEGEVLLDGVRLHRLGPVLRPVQALSAVINRVQDVAVRAEAEADGELLVKLAPGVQVFAPARTLVVASAVSRGPAEALRLVGPLEVRLGDGVQLQLGAMRWLSELARVRVSEASLHPDGSVHLVGDGRGLLDPAVRGGLSRASAGLSQLVRTSPRFLRVRRFLDA